jgi:hypothetical protein
VLLLAALVVPTGARGQDRVHLDKADALATLFPRAGHVIELRHLLSADEIAAIEGTIRPRLALHRSTGCRLGHPRFDLRQTLAGPPRLGSPGPRNRAPAAFSGRKNNVRLHP